MRVGGHEVPLAKLFTDTVILGQRHHAANDIDILREADGWHGWIGNQKPCGTPAYEARKRQRPITLTPSSRPSAYISNARALSAV